MLLFVDADLGALPVILAPVLAGDRRVGRDVLVGFGFCLGGYRVWIHSDVRACFRRRGRTDSEPQKSSDQETGVFCHTG